MFFLQLFVAFTAVLAVEGASIHAVAPVVTPAVAAARSVESDLPGPLELYRRAAATHENHIRRRSEHARRLVGLREPSAEDLHIRSLYEVRERQVMRAARKNISSRSCSSASKGSGNAGSASGNSGKSGKSGSSSTSTTSTTTSSAPGAMIAITDTGVCGAPGAVAKTTDDAGPNGSQKWLNCGIDSNGWNPPNVRVDQLITKDFDTLINSDLFAPCKQYADLFRQHATDNVLPPSLLAAFALQESTCNANSGNGGLMQITSEKCAGAPGGNCNDPDFNIGTAAKYFAKTLKDSNNNVIQAIGTYNGWNMGMTDSQARQTWNGQCTTQRNLDYVHQMLNGWLQGVSAYSNSPNMRVINNLGNC